MTIFPIRLQGMDNIMDFVNTLNTFPCSMDLMSGSRIVDAKSLMGVIAISQGVGLQLAVYEDSADTINAISTAIKSYIPERVPNRLSCTA